MSHWLASDTGGAAATEDGRFVRYGAPGSGWIPGPPRCTEILISYSRADMAAADALVEALERNGFEVTIDRRDATFEPNILSPQSIDCNEFKLYSIRVFNE